ncbi:hypothetical protein M2273_001887 [Mucilaginibacter lappiensis]|jgi:hypothetical protein
MSANTINLITNQFSVGNKLQNLAFYTMLILMLWIIVIQIKAKQNKAAKHKTVKTSK